MGLKHLIAVVAVGASTVVGFVAGTAAALGSPWPAPLTSPDIVAVGPTSAYIEPLPTTSTDRAWIEPRREACFGACRRGESHEGRAGTPPRQWIDEIGDAPVDVIARAGWDPDPVPTTRLRQRSGPLSSATFLVVHHSDFQDAPGPRAILDYHRGPAGFADIGYHFVVGVDGSVYEARPIDRVGAHAGVSVEQRHRPRLDPDDDAIGIVLDGAWEQDRPPPAQLASAVRLLRDLRERYRIPARRIIGHRDVKARIVEASGLTFAGNTTVCPGDGAFDTVPALRLLSEPRRRTLVPAGPRLATSTAR